MHELPCVNPVYTAFKRHLTINTTVTDTVACSRPRPPQVSLDSFDQTRGGGATEVPQHRHVSVTVSHLAFKGNVS